MNSHATMLKMENEPYLTDWPTCYYWLTGNVWREDEDHIPELVEQEISEIEAITKYDSQ
jgi:hypothetical protein